LITLARNDLGNKGLQNSVGFSFSELGGTTDPISPYEIDLTDYSSILATLKSKIEQFALKSGVGQVGVYLASFDECASLFEQASVDPVFSSVRWFGGDGAAFSNALLSSSNASSFAEVTHFIVPNFGLPQQVNPNLAVVAAKTGSDPDAYALSVYDATWVIAKSEAAFPNSSVDFSTLKSVFLAEADRFYGITGPIVLNAAGDRSVGSFDYWGIVTENGLFKWKLMGKSL
jgi:branched-chain amino acid transport system substrate-binding protein